MPEEAPPSVIRVPSTSGDHDYGRRSLGRLHWYRRFSAASTSTTASVRTLLPKYSPITDDDESDPDVLVHSFSQGGLGSDRLHMHVSPTLSTSEQFPPRYSAIHPRPPIIDAAVRSSDSDRQYSFPISANKPWATLYLSMRDVIPGNPRPVQSRSKVPRMWGCEPISGRLELELDSPLTIRQIIIRVKGKITTSSLDEGSNEFLDHEFIVWDESKRGLHGRNRKEKFNGKLGGSHSFLFCFPFPNDPNPPLEFITTSSNPDSPTSGEEQRVSPPSSPIARVLSKKRVRAGQDPQGLTRPSMSSRLVEQISRRPPPSVASHMPQNFIEKGVSATVSYQLSVHFVHGGFKSNSQITTNIYYIPASQPLPSSQKRRQAYEAGALIPGPISDPDGWFDLPNFSIDGPRQSKIDCQYYVGQPLSYTRGTVIPCFLTLSSDDLATLNSLSDPDIPNVRLIRRLCYSALSEDKALENVSIPSYDPLSVRFPTPYSKKRPFQKTLYHEVGMATWWVPLKDVLLEPHIRHMEGEIHLSADLQPSCSSQVFNIEYFVQVFLSEFEPTRSMQSNSSKQKVLKRVVFASLPVEITTLCRLDEPMPLPFTQPSVRHVLCDDANEENTEEQMLWHLLGNVGFL